MGFFQKLFSKEGAKDLLGLKNNTFGRLSGGYTASRVTTGKETLGSAFASDKEWFMGENSWLGPTDEQKAEAERIKKQKELEQQQYFQDVKDLYKQGFESTGLTYNPDQNPYSFAPNGQYNQYQGLMPQNNNSDSQIGTRFDSINRKPLQNNEGLYRGGGN